MAVSGVTSGANTYTSSSDSVTNPNGVLNNADFMKLFLAELQAQDPTSPMDTDKMITQTAQLTQLESYQKMQTSLEQVVNKLEANTNLSLQYSSLNLVGRMVQSGVEAFEVTGDSTKADFSLFFDKKIQDGQVEIQNEAGNTVRFIPLTNMSGKDGYVNFTWDLKNKEGVRATDGGYKAVAKYTDADGKKQESKLGSGKVDGVMFDKGEAYLRLNDSYIPLSQVQEVY